MYKRRIVLDYIDYKSIQMYHPNYRLVIANEVKQSSTAYSGLLHFVRNDGYDILDLC
jgi:hypothetical protein